MCELCASWTGCSSKSFNTIQAAIYLRQEDMALPSHQKELYTSPPNTAFNRLSSTLQPRFAIPN
jgi:hypothetical protein